MSSAPVKKIPAMFLRGLKRPSEGVLSVSTSSNVPDPEIKRTKLEADSTVHSNDTSEDISGRNEKLNLLVLIINESWKRVLRDEFQKKYMVEVSSFLQDQYKKNVRIFPPKNEIFSAFNLTSLNAIKIVVIGQDPYHNDGQAHGLSFSVKKGVRPPPSLVNIYKELSDDIPGFVTPNHGFLEGWARQGVFMLNASLTVEAHKANSHANIGWQTFTNKVISTISSNTDHVVFLLWGGFAHKKESLINKKKHVVLKTAHPSPLSASRWFGCRCFSKANTELIRMGRKPVDWTAL